MSRSRRRGEFFENAPALSICLGAFSAPSGRARRVARLQRGAGECLGAPMRDHEPRELSGRAFFRGEATRGCPGTLVCRRFTALPARPRKCSMRPPAAGSAGDKFPRPINNAFHVLPRSFFTLSPFYVRLHVRPSSETRTSPGDVRRRRRFRNWHSERAGADPDSRDSARHRSLAACRREEKS